MSRGRRRNTSFEDSDYEDELAFDRRRGSSPSPSHDGHGRVAKKPRASRSSPDGTSEEDERRRRRLLANRRSAQRSRVKRLEEVGGLENIVDELSKEVDELRTEVDSWTSRHKALLAEQQQLTARLQGSSGAASSPPEAPGQERGCTGQVQEQAQPGRAGHQQQQQRQQQRNGGQHDSASGVRSKGHPAGTSKAGRTRHDTPSEAGAAGRWHQEGEGAHGDRAGGDCGDEDDDLFDGLPLFPKPDLEAEPGSRTSSGSPLVLRPLPSDMPYTPGSTTHAMDGASPRHRQQSHQPQQHHQHSQQQQLQQQQQQMRRLQSQSPAQTGSLPSILKRLQYGHPKAPLSAQATASDNALRLVHPSDAGGVALHPATFSDEPFLIRTSQPGDWPRDVFDAASPSSHAAASGAGAGASAGPFVHAQSDEATAGEYVCGFGTVLLQGSGHRNSGGGGPALHHLRSGAPMSLTAEAHLHHPHTAALSGGSVLRPRVMGAPHPHHALVSTAAVATAPAAAGARSSNTPAGAAAAAAGAAGPQAGYRSLYHYKPSQQPAAVAGASDLLLRPTGAATGRNDGLLGGALGSGLLGRTAVGGLLGSGGRLSSSAGLMLGGDGIYAGAGGTLPGGLQELLSGSVGGRGGVSGDEGAATAAAAAAASPDSTSSNSSDHQRAVSSDSGRSLTYAAQQPAAMLQQHLKQQPQPLQPAQQLQLQQQQQQQLGHPQGPVSIHRQDSLGAVMHLEGALYGYAGEHVTLADYQEAEAGLLLGAWDIM